MLQWSSDLLEFNEILFHLGKPPLKETLTQRNARSTDWNLLRISLEKKWNRFEQLTFCVCSSY